MSMNRGERSGHRSGRMQVLAAVLGLCGAACQRPAAPPAVPNGTSTAGEPAAAPTLEAGLELPGPDVFATGRAEPYDATPTEMRDGRHLAFLVALEPGPPPQLVLDPAVFLGEAASIADGHTTYLGELPNDFYIRNLDVTTVTLPLSPAASIELIAADEASGQTGLLRVGPDDLAGWFAGTPVAGAARFGVPPSRSGDGQLTANPVHVTAEDGVIVAIEEQYIP